MGSEAINHSSSCPASPFVQTGECTCGAEIRHEAKAAIKNLKNAVAFFEKVETSTVEERIAVGSDDYKWLVEAAKRAARAL